MTRANDAVAISKAVKTDDEDAVQRELDVLLREPMKRWVNAQQVGLLAALLLGDKSPTVFKQKAFLRFVSSELDPSDAEDQKRYTSRLQTFPPNTLEALCSLRYPADREIDQWRLHRPLWNQALKFQRWDGGRSAFAGAKLIANRILAGTLSPAQLVSAARSELGRDWDGMEIYSSLGVLINRLNSDSPASRNTDSRIEALIDFRLSVQPPRWELVENAIIQQSLAWPMLVFPHRQMIGLALPMKVDVQLGTAKPPFFRSLGVIDFSDWEKFGAEPVRRAIGAAKELWLSTHGTWPQEFQDLVKNASITIDMTLAELIVGPIVESFSVADNSLESYLSLVVLSHFLGQTAIETTSATGMLDRAQPNDNGGDWYLGLPNQLGVESKIDLAQKTFFFDRILVPGKNVHVARSKGHLEICEGGLLSDFAAHTFGQEWNRHRYMRCPDIAYGFRPKVRWEKDDPQVDEILQRLRKSRSPVLEFEPGIKPANVARALYRVNFRAGLEAKEENQPTYNQLGAFAFVRLEEDEINERFWKVIWDLVKGSNSSFFDFRFAVSRSIPGQILARELNKLSPTMENPRRAPDVIVLFGSKHQSDPDDPDLPHSPFSRLHFDHLKRTLNNVLLPSNVSRVAEKIGRTRIILVPDDESDVVDNFTNVESSLQKSLERLSIFRNGFSRQMARQMLAVPNEEFEHIFRQLITNKYMAYSERAGEYSLTGRMPLPSGSLELADLHFSAANSIAGFLSPGLRDSRFDYRQAFEPERLHEAQWHLRRASRFYGGGKNAARKAQNRLTRLGEVLGWTRIRWAITARAAGIELLETVNELLLKLQGRKGDEWEPHPIEFVTAARLVFRLDQHNRNDSNYLKRRALLSLDWKTLLNRASGARYRFDEREREACQYIIQTTQACFLMCESPNDVGVQQASQFIKVALEKTHFMTKIAEVEWFEFMGDRIFGNHQSAAARAAIAYREGILNDELPITFNPTLSILSKYVASMFFAGIEPDVEVVDYIKNVSPKTRRFMETNGQLPRLGLWEAPYVRERWDLGRQKIISEIFGR